jgi:hypothetical protein
MIAGSAPARRHETTMAELRTQKTGASVSVFLEGVENEQVRADSQALLTLMKEITGAEPALWGTNIVGFGEYHYQYESGREGDWFVMGFSPRKKHVTLYLVHGLAAHEELLEKLGKHTKGGSCLHLKKLSDADPDVLDALLRRSLHKRS